jgi:hypothetical protein
MGPNVTKNQIRNNMLKFKRTPSGFALRSAVIVEMCSSDVPIKQRTNFSIKNKNIKEMLENFFKTLLVPGGVSIKR